MTEEAEPTNNGLLYKIAVAVVLGIPMTIALGIALVFYCTYEYLKFRFPSERQPNAESMWKR